MSDLLLMSPPGLPRNGLVALWDPYRDAYGLDAAARAALQTGVDYSGNGNTLTYGASTGASTDDPAFTGTAWSFDGGDYLGLGSVSAIQSLTTNFTVMSVSTANSAGDVVMFCSGRGSVSGFSVRMRPSASGGHVFAKSKVVNCISNITPVNGANEHVVWTVGSDNKARLYVGGVLKYTDTNTEACLATAFPAFIGANADSVGTLAFSVATNCYMTAIWSRALTDSEVARAYSYIKSLMAGRGVTVA